jgi:glycosyltransferase involved in cell wall biosynthesis
MNKKKICIDISNIIPGSGGSGGGIATYALNLIKGLNDANSLGELEIYCLKHPNFQGLVKCTNIKIVEIGIENKRFLNRIYWTHLYLPFFCLKNRISLLHRVTPELPLLKVCKYVCTLHDLMFDFYLSNNEIKKFLSKTEIIKFLIFKMITKHAAYISNSVIVPSYAIKNELVEKYKTKDQKIWVTHEATEKKTCNSVPSDSQSNSRFLHIGVIAGFYPHKGHMKILELARKFLNCGYTEFKITFRGNPAFPGYIREIIALKEKLNLNEHVFIIPFNAKSGLEEIYSEFNLIMLLSEYEGFGLPVLEAQAYHLPVFCSNIPVFREILTSSGYFIERKFDTFAVEKLIADLKEEKLLKALAEAGTENLKKFSWEKMSMETINLYKYVIKN